VLVIDGNVTNSKTVEALGAGATVSVAGTISNTPSGLILASGIAAKVRFDGPVISAGTLKTSGFNAAIAVEEASVIKGATIAPKALVEAIDGAVLTMSGGAMGAGAIVKATSGSTVIVSGTVANSGGTLFASDSGSRVQIASGAVVHGGVAEVGNGVVEIAGSSGENVAFLAFGTGGLVLDQLGSAYTGKVSGFGGSGHSDHNQFIDFLLIGSGASVTYTSAASHTSGTLTVTSGSVSATVTLVGTYSAGNFSGSTVGGHVRITDPAAVNGGSAELGNTPTLPQQGIGLPNIAFGARTTLAYVENSTAPGLGMSEGRYAAAAALLGNYMAGSFLTAAHGTLVTEVQQLGQQPLLTHPPHG
jgi:hypothetical protein